jgi:tetratricopeptide (TPR) repeat protein
VGAAAVAAALWAVPASADRITLTNGRVIEADRAWVEGNEVRYSRGGGTFGVPRVLVSSLDQSASPEPTDDPDVLGARERLAGGRPVEAVRLLQTVVDRQPDSRAGHETLAEAHLALGDAVGARRAAEQLLRLDPRSARARSLLGDALLALGDRAGAEEQYERSLRLRHDPAVLRKRAALSPGPASASPFLLRFEGAGAADLGPAVLRALEHAHGEFARILGFRPTATIAVVLQAEAAFQETSPPWAGGLNDGTIRLPVRGVQRLTPRLLALLRHELAHSFVAARTGGNCPTWLQEGVAQWLEGGDPGRADAGLLARARQGGLRSLLTLEGPFQELPAPALPVAYAQSLSAVAHILRREGPEGVRRLVAALGDGRPTEEALPVALGLSYPEFQRSWEGYLRSSPAGQARGQGPASR